MILIDKEKFIEEVRKRKYSSASIKLIEEQPEVIAIPIEWIQVYLDTKFLPIGQKESIRRMVSLWEEEWVKKNNDKQ